MKKLTYLLFLAIGVTSCSVESVDSTEYLLTADAKFKITEVEKSMTLKMSEICEGDAPVFIFNFPQNENGQGKTDIKIQIETFPGSGQWESFEDLTYYDAGPKEYTYTDQILGIGHYSFRGSVGSGGKDFNFILNVVECSECEESFNYSANEDGSYTFTYIPEEDMAEAEVVFTFAQSVVTDGYDWVWNGNSSTRTEIMNLEACEIYTWTLTLKGDCSGNSKESNLWTDFKVNDVSKKGSLSNIQKSCN